jgi:hypothetical protein
MKANGSKSTKVTFTTLKDKYPPVYIKDVHLSQEEGFRYLGLRLDRRLIWHKHIFTKRKQLGITLTLTLTGYSAPS